MPDELSTDGESELESLLRAVANAPPVLPSSLGPTSSGDDVGRAIGRFVLEERLGAGGMGVVYRARDTRLMRDVALKLLPPRSAQGERERARLVREARAAARVSSPHVAAIYDVEGDAPEAYLAMELVTGPSLRDVLAAGPLAEARALTIARQIALGLAAAHAKGVAHRDLKPENVVLTAAGQVKILDFGLARLTEIGDAPAPSSRDGSALATRAGTVLGTPAYMAPEQARGEPADARSDVFSFGVVLVEMLTGQRLFTGGARAAREAVASWDPASATLPTGRLGDVARGCLAPDPARRFQTGEALSQALADRPPWRGRGALVRGVAALSVVTALAVGFGLGVRGVRGAPEAAPARLGVELPHLTDAEIARRLGALGYESTAPMVQATPHMDVHSVVGMRGTDMPIVTLYRFRDESAAEGTEGSMRTQADTAVLRRGRTVLIVNQISQPIAETLLAALSAP